MIQVYTGKGKGKTTAALGLALRAHGAGLKVHIIQFLKKGNFSELKALKEFKKIKVEQFGEQSFVRVFPGKEDAKIVKQGLKRAKEIIQQKKSDLVILDEINMAMHFGLIKVNDVVSMIKKLPDNLELILTGRHAPDQIIELADLVSDVTEVKHYYSKGLQARKGFEF